MPSAPASTVSELVRGSVIWAAPDPTVGREQSGRRSLVVVASDAYLATVTELVLAVPVTTTARGWPNHIPLTGPTGLQEACFAMTEQIRAISRARIDRIAGTVDSGTLVGIDLWLRDFLGLH